MSQDPDRGAGTLSDRRFLASLASFVACVAAFSAVLWLFVRWGGWKAIFALGAVVAILLFRFYRGARPDLPKG